MHVLDWIVFVAVLAGSLGIGVWHSFGQKSSTEYLQGRRQMGVVPVSISTMVTFMSAITLQGVPAEVYAYGLLQYLATLIGTWGSFLALWTFVPLYFNLDMVSIFQYLEKRFNHRAPSFLACGLTIVVQICLMGIATIGPAQILQSTTSIPTWANILIMTGVCTVYTSIGGIKAVVWADVLQAGIMFLGIIAVIIVGWFKLENPGDVWAEMESRGKMEVNWSLSPFVRNSFWIACFSMATANLQCYHYQAAMMRYTALNSLNKARITVVVGTLGFVVLSLLCSLAAVMVFGYYAQSGCDPLAAGEIYSSNQVIPYFVTSVITLPGVPGLFVSAIVASTLSTVSSIQNGLAAVTWQEFFSKSLGKISESKKMWVLKASVVMYGLASLIFAFLADSVGGSLFQISNAAMSVFGGPSFGIFLTAGLFPFVGPWSVVIGCCVSLVLSLWVSIGSLFHSPAWSHLITIDDTCQAVHDVFNATTSVTPSIVPPSQSALDYMYSISPYLYITLGAGLCMLISLTLSIIPGMRQKGEVEPSHLFPFVSRIIKHMRQNRKGYTIEKAGFLSNGHNSDSCHANGAQYKRSPGSKDPSSEEQASDAMLLKVKT